MRGKGRRSGHDEASADPGDTSKERGRAQSKNRGSTRRSKSSSVTRREVSSTKQDSSDESDDVGGGLAGMSLSVGELAKQRELRAQKAQRAAKKAERQQTREKRPPSAASQQLQGNSDFLANELGITKAPRRRRH